MTANTPQTLYFRCPSCAAEHAQVEEPDQVIHAGATLTLQRAPSGSGPGSPEHGDADQPHRHPVGLPLLQARHLPVGPAHRRGR